MSRDDLIERIAEAEDARHRLALGGLQSYTTTNGEQFNRHTLGQLTKYVHQLRMELASMPDPNGAGGYGFHTTAIEGAY